MSSKRGSPRKAINLLDDGETVIDITPHYGAMTKAGKANFNRFSDGAAEFIDNSLQSYKKVTGCKQRAISLYLCLNTDDNDKKSSFMVVADSGIGMDKKDIKEFATYSLDQKTRNLTDAPFIGKFGVGAKQSGFFLGDRIRVISRKNSGPIHEVILDESEFEERHASNRKVYETVIHTRSAHSKSQMKQFTPGDEKEEEKMQDFIEKHECESDSEDAFAHKDHFTIIIIKLKREVVQGLCVLGRYREVPCELAQVYHFHLHPKNLPQRIIDSDKFKYGSVKSHDRQQIFNQVAQPVVDHSSRKRDRATEVEPDLNIYFEVTQNGFHIVNKLNLRELVNDEVKEHIQNAQSVFRFDMSFYDPKQNIGEISVAKNLSKQMNEESQCTVQGMIFYYPYVDGKESRPALDTRRIGTDYFDEGIEYVHQGISKSQSNLMSSQMTGDDESVNKVETEDRNHMFHAFDIYWVDRFVPQSYFTNIPLLPKSLETPAQCEKEGISLDWKKRIKGYVFFNSSWEHISNNKLKIQVDPDINTYLNSCEKRGGVTFKPTSAKSNFKAWLKACHDEFDRETRLKDRLHSLEMICLQFERRYSTLKMKDSDPFSSLFFQSLDVGSATSEGSGVRVGDTVKLFINENNTLSKRSYIIAKILAFDIPNTDAISSAAEHYGDGRVRYLRLPLCMYHPRVAKSTSNSQREEQKKELAKIFKSSLYSGLGMSYDGDYGKSRRGGGTSRNFELLPEHFFANVPAPISAIKMDDRDVTDHEIQKLIDEGPHRLKVELMQSKGNKAKELKTDAPTNFDMGKEYYKISVQILKKNGKLCISKPLSRKKASDKYFVSMELLKNDNDNWNRIRSFGKTNDYWTFNEDHGSDVKMNTELDKLKDSDMQNVSLGFFNVKINSPGEYKGRFHVLDDDVSLLTKEFLIRVKAESLAKSSMRFQEDAVVDMIHSIDEPLPMMIVSFRDKFDNVYSFEKALPILFKIEVTDQNELCTCFIDSRNDEWPLPIFAVSEDEFPLEDFNIERLENLSKPGGKRVLKNRVPFMSALNPTDEFRMSFKLSVFLDPKFTGARESKDTDAYSTIIGEHHFTLLFRPGEVAQLVLHPEIKEPIIATNNHTLPSIRLLCHDSWGHATTTRRAGDTWRVTLSPHHLIRGSQDKDSSEVVNNDGIAIFTDLSVDTDQMLRPEGLLTQLEFKVEKRKKGKSEIFEATGVLLKLPVTILPDSNAPTFLQVCHKGMSLTEFTELRAGEELTDLSFNILNGNKELIEEFPEQWFTKKGSSVTLWAAADAEVPGCQWASKRSTVKFKEDRKLPDIKLPEQVGSFEFEAQLKLYAGRNRSIDLEACTFQVKVLPDKAVSWKVITDSDQAPDIMFGDNDSLRKHIGAIVLQDRFNNYVSFDEMEFSLPQLKVHVKPPVKETITPSKRHRSPGISESVTPLDKKSRGNQEVAHVLLSESGLMQREDTESEVESEENAALTASHSFEDEQGYFRNDLEEIHSDGVLILNLVKGYYNQKKMKSIEASKLAEMNDSDEESFKVDAIACFLIPSDREQSLVIPRDNLSTEAPMMIWLKCSSSKEDGISSHTLPVNLVKGFVSGVFVTCDDLNMSDGPVSSGYLELNQFTDVSLLVSLKDKSEIWDGVADIAKKCKPKFYIMEASSGDKLVDFNAPQRQSNFSVPLLVSSFADKIRNAKGGVTEDGKPYDIELKCSFEYSRNRQCEPAFIKCKLTKLNSVRQLTIRKFRYDGEVYSDISDIAEISCEETLPFLRIFTDTDDGVVYVPPLSSISFEMSHEVLNGGIAKPSKSRRTSTSSVQSLRWEDDYEEPIQSLENDCIEFKPRRRQNNTGKRKYPESEVDTTIALPVGKLDFTFSLKESRKKFTKVSETEYRCSSAIQILPASPVKLIILNQDRLFANALATNFGDETRQIVKEPVIIRSEDKYGNVSSFPFDCEVKATVRCQDTDQTNLPVLSNSKDGYLVGEKIQNGTNASEMNYFEFSNLEISPASGSDEMNRLQLVFSYYSPDNSLVDDVVADFEFMTDKKSLSEVKKIRDELTPLKECVLDFEQTMEQLESRDRDVLDRLGSEIQKFKEKSKHAPGFLRQVIETAEKIEYSRLEAAKNDISKDLASLNDNYRKAVKKSKNIPKDHNYIKENCLGLAVDLGYVEDENTARILSCSANRYIDSVICHDEKDARILYKKGIKSWCLSDMKTFKKEGSERTKTEKEMQSLPLAKLSGKGNPRYCVNVIQLDREYEYLRDNLFWSIFSNSIIFDTTDDALDYKKRKISSGVRPPLILTMEGDRFPADGIYDPNLKVPRNVQIMFGEQPPANREDTKKRQVEIDTAQTLMSLVKERDDIREKLNELRLREEEINSNVDRIRLLEIKMTQLRP
eukprot:GSChrysophyteH1.ASY1.ANO1.1272.1 assembled CDS